MLLFRTILLWLSFTLLLLQYFITIDFNLEIGVVYRLLPSGLLILWFLLSVFSREKLVFDPNKVPTFSKLMIKYLRPIASLSIILGAFLKILKMYNSNEFLVIGIGFMSLYSSLIYFYTVDKQNRPDDIIDDNLL
jgi:hypothetical protein